MSKDAATAVAAWGNAWLTGHVGLDEAVDAVEKIAGPQILRGAPAGPPPRGPADPNGAPGPNGANWPSGANWPNEPNGATDPNGAAGTNGSARTNGSAGTIGSAGTDGSARPNGTGGPYDSGRPNGPSRPNGPGGPNAPGRPNGPGGSNGPGAVHGSGGSNGSGAADGAAEAPLRARLGELRVAGMTALRLALPEPGDPLGLTGPPAFNRAAIDAGAAVVAVFGDRAVGLVPSDDLRGSSYVGICWTACDAVPAEPDVPSLADADRQLALAMRDATEALLTVDDFAGVPSEITDALAALRDPDRGDHPLAPGYPARAHRVAALAGRLSLVVDLARRMDDRGLGADQMRRRGEALRLLDRAVRRALVAACNSAFDPVP